MMSDSLIDTLSYDEIKQHENKFVICTFYFEVDSKIEPLIGSLSFFLRNKDLIELNFKISLDDAYSINMSWPDLSLISFQMKLGEEISHFQGPFLLEEVGLAEIDHERRTCVLLMKIKKEHPT
jgi:hypothetical protein